MKRRIPAGTLVRRGWSCTVCETDDAFVTTVSLGDYVELSEDTCPNCGYKVLPGEAKSMKDKAWESAPEDAIDERLDAISERNEP